jgi:hypothetical protein
MKAARTAGFKPRKASALPSAAKAPRRLKIRRPGEPHAFSYKTNNLQVNFQGSAFRIC